MGELDSKVIVITGASGGVGSVVSRMVGAAGAKLALWDRSAEPMEDVDCGDAEVIRVVADITDPESVSAAVHKTADHYGRIDALMHIAGGFAMPGPVHEGHLDVWQKMMALNATGVYITAGAVAEYMVQQGIQGSISIIAARGAQAGGKHSAAYAASKSAAVRVMESMAAELREARVRVNALSPSIVDTPANRDAMGEEKADLWVAPAEIANTLIFLASDKASAITGTNVGIYKWV
jgi:NAD(P)-dependent dehydrogenase (short-subunit alcohol dehydrogenase family)